MKKREEDILRKNFEIFFRENYARFYYYALRFIPEEETCKDLVSDTFSFMWERIENMQMDTALTYMYTHLQRLCIDYLRKQERTENNKQSYLSEVRNWNGAEEREKEERIKTIMRLIEQMPPQTRSIMEQCYLEKKTYREVALLTGLTESGVRKHIMKGLNTIREYFSVNYKKGEKNSN